MLYVTTRGRQDAYTAYRTMNQDRAPDGGWFVPMRLPVLEQKEIWSLANRSFGQTVADILNFFFGTKLTSWDVDVTVGRHVTALKPAGHRTWIAELWHNAEGNFDRLVSSVANRIHPDGACVTTPTNWMQIAVRIATVFGVFGELMKAGELKPGQTIDVAVTSGAFSSPMALWYARSMGLPVGNIICGCNENGAPWDLLHRGQVDTGTIAVKTTTPEADYALPPDMERLISAVLGEEEALHYWWCCTEGGMYALPEMCIETFREGMFAAVVSQVRVASLIPSVYRTNRYILDIYSALAYGALSDYRARTGAVRTAVVLMEKSPLCNAAAVSGYLRISSGELKELLSR